MNIFAKIGHALVDAFQVNLTFLTTGFADLPEDRSLLANELRDFVERDLAILVHKRNKWSEGNEIARERWFSDLETFVSRTLRPQLAGESLIALWNDVVLMRALDAVVAKEQLVRAEAPSRVPVTCRFDSHWAT